MKNHKEIKKFLPVIEGVVALFTPFVEAAVHDLHTGTITALYNNISKRKIGDPSPLHELKMPVDQFPDVFEPYYKTNWDGKKLKCTSITIRDENRKPIALICFNFDTSVFRNIELNLKMLLDVKKTADNPIELFNENWQQKTDSFITAYLRQKKLLLHDLTKEQKQKLIQELIRHGVFNYKNAANYIAGQLHISRASVYNYMK